MDNLTHSLTGLVLAKSGLERLSPAATPLCVVVANAPDFDILTLLTGDRWIYLHHHRGITHSIIGVLVLIVLMPALFYACDFAIARVRKRPPRLRYRGLLLASFIAGVSHPLMDWTNNYGIRPFLPWSGRWFYGDLVFIIDPFLWIVLGGAGFLLTSKSRWQLIFWSVLALVLTGAVLFLPQQREAIPNVAAFRVIWLMILAGILLARRAQAGDRLRKSLALAACAVVLIYWGALGFAHALAYSEAQVQARQIAALHGDTVSRVAAMPTLVNPFDWQCISDTDRATYRFRISLIGTLRSSFIFERFEKPKPNELRAISVASEDARARILLGFARFPAARVTDVDCMTQTVVHFADLRYTEPGGARRGTFALDVPISCPPKNNQTEVK
ncbi:MAG: metal-dependent hydrolase [Pyrinomonadaceae bacterium]